MFEYGSILQNRRIFWRRPHSRYQYLTHDPLPPQNISRKKERSKLDGRSLYASHVITPNFEILERDLQPSRVTNINNDGLTTTNERSNGELAKWSRRNL
jgi:hypothetical protein